MLILLNHILKYAEPYWAAPFELCCTLLSYAAPPELRCILKVMVSLLATLLFVRDAGKTKIYVAL
jgi:hypothetical protein